MKKNLYVTKGVAAGIVIFLLIFAFSFLGPLIRPCGEYTIFYSKDGVELTQEDDISQAGVVICAGAAPSASHPLGTDREGRDVLIRLMLGGRVSILLSLFTVLLMCVLGIFFGVLCGLDNKGYADEIIMRLADLINCIPDIPLILILSSLVIAWGVPERYRIYGLMGVIGAFGWTSVARLVRSRIKTLKEQEFILAARLSNVPFRRQVVSHMLPYVMPQVISVASINAGYVVLTESAISFLGFGVSYPYASWGNMIMTAFNAQLINRYVHVWLPAGLLIFLLVLSFHLIGEGLCKETGEDMF